MATDNNKDYDKEDFQEKNRQLKKGEQYLKQASNNQSKNLPTVRPR